MEDYLYSFCSNAPQQNPIEDIWLQAKRFIREFYHLCQSFNTVKYLFEFVLHHQIFNFPKLYTYGFFS
jgi:transposase